MIRVQCNHCYSGKAINITYSESVFVALGIQYATRMRHIVICGLVRIYKVFSTLSHKRRDFRKQLLSTKCVFWLSLQLLSETFHTLRKKKKLARYEYNMYIGLHVIFLLFFSDFNETWIFSTDFWKVVKYRMSLKSVQWKPSRSRRMDRWTDMTKLMVAFRNFANAPKNDVVSVAKMWKWGFFFYFQEYWGRP
jgi:hypothetical protein